jgi:dnd system-associated protein 4
LAFAAAYGAANNKWMSFRDATNAPIRQEVFSSRGYDTLINLLAVQRSEDPMVLANSEEADKKRVESFEGFVNGGLELLREALKGAVDYQDAIVLHVLAPAREGTKTAEGVELDISKILD